MQCKEYLGKRSMRQKSQPKEYIKIDTVIS